MNQKVFAANSRQHNKLPFFLRVWFEIILWLFKALDDTLIIVQQLNVLLHFRTLRAADILTTCHKMCNCLAVEKGFLYGKEENRKKNVIFFSRFECFGDTDVEQHV